MPLRDDSVAVIITAYNARDSIARSVRSALAQSRVEEVFVCDDASQDDTVRLAQDQDDNSGRLSVLKLSRNRGPAAARNAALAAAKSAYVCVLDADDYLLPGRIDCMLHGHGDWDLLADDIIIVPEDLEPVNFVLEPKSHRSDFSLDLATFVQANISRPGQPRAEWGFLKPLMSRAFLAKNDLRYDETLRLGEDYALYVRTLLAGARFRVTGACGYVAIEREGSISSRHTARDLKSIVDFDARCLSESRLMSIERLALEAHRRATKQKYDHKLILDIKREHGRAAALTALLRYPGSIPYIVAETIRAKGAASASHRHRLGGPDAYAGEEHSRSGIRFLVGDRAGSKVRYTSLHVADGGGSLPARI